MKSANKKLNANRDVQNRIGRAVITKGVEAVSAEDLARLKLTTPASRSRGRAAPKFRSIQTPEDVQTFNYSSTSKAQPKKTLYTPSRSTGKRQRPTSTRSGRGKVKIESDESDDEDVSGFSDDNYGDTPTKRRASGARSTKIRGRSNTTNNSVLFGNAVATNPAPSRKRSVRTAAINATATIQSAIKGLDESPEELEEQEEQERRDLAGLEDVYKKRICDVLEVDHALASHLLLNQLRTYARAYNAVQGNTEWVLPGFPQAYCIGQMVYGLEGHPENADGVTEVHITLAFGWSKELALARGDLLPDLTLDPNGPRNFDSEGHPEIDEALGFLDNAFGFFA